MRSVSGQSQGAPAVTRVKDGNQHSLRCHLERERSGARDLGFASVSANWMLYHVPLIFSPRNKASPKATNLLT
jgi:hypothetical protein